MDHKLNIKDFLIRYVYTSFITTKEIDLDNLASILLINKVTKCILLDNNIFLWTENETLNYGISKYSDFDECHIIVDTSGKKINLPPDINYFYIRFINKRITENIIIHKDGNINYIEFYTDPVIFSDDDKETVFYPYMKIFQDSITVTKYEFLTKNIEISTEDFISKHVNLSTHFFNKLSTSPYIYHLMIEAYHKTKKNKMYDRFKIITELRKSKKALTTNIFTKVFNQIEYSFVTSQEERNQTLSDLNISLNNVIAYLISMRKNEFYYLLIDRKKIYQNGNLWVGRPYIYLKDFENIKKTGTENNNFFGMSFQYIMYRGIVDNWISIKEDSKKSLRLRDDSLYFTNSAVSLFVNGKSIIETGSTTEILDNLEVIEDYIEYGYMINKALLQLTKSSLTPEEINKLRWKANYLIDFEQITYFHDTRHWIKESLQSRSINLIKEQTKEAFEIRLQERLYTTDKKNKDLSISLSVIFGLLASVSIAEFIGEPLLKKLDFFNSLDVLWIKSASFFITLFIIWAYIGFIRYRHK